MLYFLDNAGTFWKIAESLAENTLEEIAKTTPPAVGFAIVDRPPTTAFFGSAGSHLIELLGHKTVDLGPINGASKNGFFGIDVSDFGGIWLCGNDGLFKYGNPAQVSSVETYWSMKYFRRSLLIGGEGALNIYRINGDSHAAYRKSIEPTMFGITEDLDAAFTCITGSKGDPMVRIVWTSHAGHPAGTYLTRITTCKWSDLLSSTSTITSTPKTYEANRQAWGMAETGVDELVVGYYGPYIEKIKFGGRDWTATAGPTLNRVDGYVKWIQRVPEPVRP